VNYKQAAGRNWARAERRNRPVHLALNPDAATVTRNVFQEEAEIRRAAGRNWSREARPLRRAHLQPQQPDTFLNFCPARELGGGDHDRPYAYHQPSSRWTFPFSTRQYARLLVLRGRLAERQPLRLIGKPATSKTTSSAAAAAA
jgi:hypothetical protein